MNYLSNIREGSASGLDSWYECEVPGPSAANTQGVLDEDLSAMEPCNDLKVSGRAVSI